MFSLQDERVPVNNYESSAYTSIVYNGLLCINLLIVTCFGHRMHTNSTKTEKSHDMGYDIYMRNSSSSQYYMEQSHPHTS
jgi:hypothetical protein